MMIAAIIEDPVLQNAPPMKQFPCHMESQKILVHVGENFCSQSIQHCAPIIGMMRYCNLLPEMGCVLVLLQLLEDFINGPPD